MNTNNSLFTKKELYLTEHNDRGRSFSLEKLPTKSKRKLIYDNMHLTAGMEFTQRLEFPKMKPYTGTTDFVCVPYTQRNKYNGKNRCLHFFLNDYQFRDAVWNNLEYTTRAISSYDYLFTPDLSLWKNYPTDYYNRQNIFRTRFIGAYWQLCGFNVIPTASWGGLASFDYCFEGLPVGSVIAVSGIGNRKDSYSFNRWCYGIRRLEDATRPTLIMVYGQKVEIEGIHTPLQFIPDFISTNLRTIKCKSNGEREKQTLEG